MKYNELVKHAETCQMAADELAHGFNDFIEKVNILSVFQSQCDFNVFFIYSVWPEGVLHIETVKFLNNNKDKFKRKLNKAEVLRFDQVIDYFKPETFEDFKKLLNQQ